MKTAALIGTAIVLGGSVGAAQELEIIGRTSEIGIRQKTLYGKLFCTKRPRSHLRGWLQLVAPVLAVACGQAHQAHQPTESFEMSEQAVIVHFDYGTTDLDPLFVLEQRLETAIADAEAGEFDGNEIATDGSDGYLYMYGPDADRLFSVVKPILQSVPFMRGARVTVRYGPPDNGVPERRLTIDGS